MLAINSIPVVIFAGGLGTRLREETEYKPKPMVSVGNYPILWHIMKSFSFYGFNRFIICAGYKREAIQDYFLNFHFRNNDIEINLEAKNTVSILNEKSDTNWRIQIMDTGENTNTGGRLKRIEHLIETDNFFCTYGDGLADVDIQKLLEYHLQEETIATLTSVKPPSRFGVLNVDEYGLVKEFLEKPPGETWVNGGFFVFNKKIFQFLEEDSVLEEEPLRNLVELNELKAFRHEGFWQPMDTYREFILLNKLWNSGEAPWKKWK